MPTTRSGMTPKAIDNLIAQRMAEALATYEANRNNGNLIESEDENDDGNEVVMEVKTVMEMVMKVETVMEMVMEVETETEMELERKWKLEHLVGIDVAYAMTWKELMKMMTEVYCPMNEIQKLENKL
ncbi:hypothetical protein Tco_1502771 [Tanacetum coccineum]